MASKSKFSGTATELREQHRNSPRQAAPDGSPKGQGRGQHSTFPPASPPAKRSTPDWKQKAVLLKEIASCEAAESAPAKESRLGTDFSDLSCRRFWLSNGWTAPVMTTMS